MANGQTWFMLDCKDDNKVKLLKARHGLIGYAAWVELLKTIYGNEGYYMEWSDEICEVFSAQNLIKKQKMGKILQDCIDLGLFDKQQFDQNSVLTSAAIQTRYMQYKKRATVVRMHSCFLCTNFDPSVYKNLKIVYKNSNSVCNSDTILSYSTISNFTDDDDMQHPVLDTSNLELNFGLLITRAREMYEGNLATLSKIDAAYNAVLRIARMENDPDVIRNINNVDSSNAWLLYEKAELAYGFGNADLYSDAERKRVIHNPEGYLMTSMRNLFKEMHGKSN